MKIRRFEPADVYAVAEIFYRSVHEVACAKYDAAQIAAWAPGDLEPERWLERLCAFETFVAENDAGSRVGWIAMTESGYVDMLFCLPEATRCGVSDALYAEIEAIAVERGLRCMTAHASLLAQPFFARHGWVVDRHEVYVRDGVGMPRAEMSKVLDRRERPNEGDGRTMA